MNTHLKNLLVVELYSVLLILVLEEKREKPPSTWSAMLLEALLAFHSPALHLLLT